MTPPWDSMSTPENDAELRIRREWDAAFDDRCAATTRMELAAKQWEVWREQFRAEQGVSIESLIHALRAHGHAASVCLHGPTDVEIYLDKGKILLAKDFNVTGWEAAYEEDDVQTPLEDGPGSNDAPMDEVLPWALALASDWKAHVA